MARPRMLWLLRIAVSVACGILCLLLTAMWVRSYYTPVQLHLIIIDLPPYLVGVGSWGTAVRYPENPWLGDVGIESWKGMATLICFPPRLTLKIHFLLLVLLFGALAGLPWVQWSRRFSLRTFLVVTGFLAVMLGLLVVFRPST